MKAICRRLLGVRAKAFIGVVLCLALLSGVLGTSYAAGDPLVVTTRQDGDNPSYSTELADEGISNAGGMYDRGGITSGGFEDRGYQDMQYVIGRKVTTEMNDALYQQDGQVFAAVGWKEAVIDGKKKKLISISIRGMREAVKADGDRAIVTNTTETANNRHAGFEACREQLSSAEGQISFDFAGDTKSLKEIIEEIRSGSDEYFLLVSGHSMGAAITNLYVASIVDSMPNPNNAKDVIAGYGFATPEVATAGHKSDYPITNFININDRIPTVGVNTNFGNALVNTDSNDGKQLGYNIYFDPNDGSHPDP